ncbi:MAG: hypothetical protein GWP19_00310 [Planctomycetia bacterium]|nr:hypothetical protein [Planctomycetia bacterium]
MAAGDITMLGPFDVDDATAIDTALTGAVVVADTFTSWVYNNQVYFSIVKAA